MCHPCRIYEAELAVLTKLPAGGRSKPGKSVIKHMYSDVKELQMQGG